MNIFYTVLCRGLSEENFKALSPTKQIKYIKEHPTSKYGKDPKWLKRAKMLKTKMLNAKKEKKSSLPYKSPKTVDNAIKVSRKINRTIKKSEGAKKAETIFKNIRDTKKVAKDLTKGTYKIRFKKLDGSIRELIGSMEDKYLKKMKFANGYGKPPRKKNPNIVTVIDTELKPPEFRSFRIERLISMEPVK